MAAQRAATLITSKDLQALTMSHSIAATPHLSDHHRMRQHSPTFDPAPAAIRRWIRALPLADHRATIRLTSEALRRLNKTTMPIAARAHALALFTPLVNTLIKRIAQHYAQSQRPFSRRRGAHFNSVQAMLSEITRGYLIIIQESPLPSPLRAQGDSKRYNARSIPAGSDTHHLCRALYQAIEHLAQRLLHSYLLYTPPAIAVWSEIHRLYYIAETYNIPATPFSLGLNEHPQQRQPVSIEHAYKRILLFSLANPYHLMPNEMSRAYQSLRSWAPQCKIIRSDSPEKLHGRFYIDLESDLPPTHHTLNQHDLELPSLRLLDINEILPSEKYQRALDRRLAQALIVRPERLTKRTTATAAVTLANGLAACHHFIDCENRTATILNHHDSIKLPTTSVKNDYTTQVAQQRDISLGGMALHHSDPEQYLPTGALISYRPAADSPNESWRIGTVKWSRNSPENRYDLGIKCLAENGTAVMACAIDNAGNRREHYHRALLTPNVDPLIHPTTLITPIDQFNVGDQLHIHTERQPFSVELIQLIDSTWAYAHYRYRIIASHAH